MGTPKNDVMSMMAGVLVMEELVGAFLPSERAHVMACLQATR